VVRCSRRRYSGCEESSANVAAPSIATPELPRVNDLIRVVLLHATVMASGSLTYF
jgi:hypothetical protein